GGVDGATDAEIRGERERGAIVGERDRVRRRRTSGEIDADDAGPRPRDLDEPSGEVRRFAVERAEDEAGAAGDPFERGLDDRLDRIAAVELGREADLQRGHA